MKYSHANRLGIFICHCGVNISSTVDIETVKKALTGYPGVSLITDHTYTCSNPGQDIIRNKIREEELDSVVIAACSPSLHENTFRKTLEEAGINPYKLEIANIREQCSWVHSDRKVATEKAISIIKAAVSKALLNEPLTPISVPVTRKALVVGGGIAGIQASLNIANSGYKVILVEKEPSIGGKMAQLSETFPTLDCSQCILTHRMVEVERHPNINLMVSSEVTRISGFVGNFEVTIRKKKTYVNAEKCNGCGICIEKCPRKTDSEFDRALSKRKVIYRPFPQAVPNIPVIDGEHCLYLLKGRCGVCRDVCGPGAIEFEQEERFVKEKVGAIVIATGYETFPIENIPEYGGGTIPDVIDGLAFERILSASGPTGGEIRRPSDGKVPKEVAFIQCVCSRDPERYFSYCSKVCCMYTSKHAMLYKHRVEDGQPYVFYIDIRAGGKGYEEFYQRASEEDEVLYIRGKVSRLYREDGKIVVEGTDTLLQENVAVRVDMVVLATAIRPSQDVSRIAQLLKASVDENGFFTEAHPKLRPVESMTAGVFLAGCAQAPRDIPDTVSGASAAALMVCNLFASEELKHEPTIAGVDEDVCSGCGICIGVCPYEARELDREKRVATVNEVLCEGCGACTAACPSGAAVQRNFTDKQISSMIKAILA